jgi:calpain-15
MGNVCCAERAPSDGQYEKALENIKTKGGLFEDPDFPATKKSLIPDWNDGGDDTTSIVEEWGTIAWLRPDKITLGKEKAVGAPMLFEKGIEPNDIRQGALGDCYFLSSLSVIAEEGRRIEKLFHDKGPGANAQGIYACNITKNGLSV